MRDDPDGKTDFGRSDQRRAPADEVVGTRNAELNDITETSMQRPLALKLVEDDLDYDIQPATMRASTNTSVRSR